MREEREARLALERPLLRTNIVRRETSPISGFSRYVAITNSPSGKFSIGPRSTSCSSWFVNDGRTAKPRTGSVIAPPITAPRPSVVSLEEGAARIGLDLLLAVAGSAALPSTADRASGCVDGLRRGLGLRVAGAHGAR